MKLPPMNLLRMNLAPVGLIAVLAITSCSPGVDPMAALVEADQLAADENWPAAFDAYERAALGFGQATPELELAQRGSIKALAASKPLDSLHRAKSHIEQFIATNGDGPGPDLIGGIAGDYLEVENLDAAALVTALGRKRYPTNPGLRNLESRLNGLTWQAMGDDLAAIGYLRQNKSQAAIDLGLVDASGATIAVGGESLLQLIDPATYKLILEQGYMD